jgi:hypothetical protein
MLKYHSDIFDHGWARMYTDGLEAESVSIREIRGFNCRFRDSSAPPVKSDVGCFGCGEVALGPLGQTAYSGLVAKSAKKELAVVSFFALFATLG